MARTFNGSTQSIQTTPGALSAMTFGTIAVVCKRNSTGWNSLLTLHNSTGTSRIGIEIEGAASGKLQWQYDGNFVLSAAITVANGDGWVLVAIGKATGTATPRVHKYVYSTDTWTHENAAGTATNSTSIASTGTCRFGEWEGSDWLNGDIAAAAVWSGRNLADAEMEELPYSLIGWYSTVPDAMWLFDQQATGTKLLDITGGGANESGGTVPSVSANSVPILGYGHDVIVLSSSAAAGGTNATVTPIAIQATTSVPAPDVSAGATVTPNAVQATTSVPAPALSAGATVSPNAIQATTSVPAPTLSAGATVSPNAIQAATSVPAPALSAGSTVTPAAISLTTSIPLPAVSAGGNVNITPAAISPTTSIPAPALSAGATVLPSAVQAVTSVPPVALSTGATVQPPAVLAAASLPAPVTSAGASLTAVAVLAVTTLPAPGRSAGSTVTPLAVLASATLPAPVISANLDAHVSPVAILATTVVRVVTVVVEAPSQPLPGAQIPGTGGWLQLLQILREESAGARALAEDPFEIHLHEADYRSSGPPLTAPAPSRPLACPNDGEPLSLGSNGILYCTFDGWQYGLTTAWTDE